MNRSFFCLTLGLVFFFQSRVQDANDDLASKDFAKPFLEKHCVSCHDESTKEGGVNLDSLQDVTADNAEIWKRVWEQVALSEMPPRDESEQPSLHDRYELSREITSRLQLVMKNKGGFQTHLLPAKANHVPHDLLFGKLPTDLKPTSTPARLWRIHPQEHLVRLNALMNEEPVYQPQKPGVRTHGDMIPPNQDGEVKVYYGLDRVIGWVGGTAAYAAAITGFPPLLSEGGNHGLRSYPIEHSVNGAEASLIAGTAEDILRFMAYGPSAKPYQFADRVQDIPKEYKHESLRGLAESLFYSNEIKRPLTPVYELMRGNEVTDEKLRNAVVFLFESLTCRSPSAEETQQYVKLARETIEDLGKEKGALLGLVPIFLDRDALFRSELANYGKPDEHGRVMLQGAELMLAINSAFSYLPPDSVLKEKLNAGELSTRVDVRREVKRILDDPSIRKPRLLQFFREYFDYDRAGAICKDNKALVQAGGVAKNYYRAMHAMVANTDRLVELILEEDRDVFKELLTTDRVVYNAGTDAGFFGEFVGRRKPMPGKSEPANDKKNAKEAKRKKKNAGSPLVELAGLPKGETIHVRIAEVVRGNKTQRQLTTLPAGQRMGILTHPSWLVSHSDAMDNHAIHRGKWIRERLLGDAVPDVPITVDAMLPDEPGSTLRHRMRVTREDQCWRCHQKMDPLGLPFEMYNHIGLYRKIELNKPVDTIGEIVHSGDSALDGPVGDAVDLIQKLANSERVQQVFVRHVFRFWVGRNETVDDAPVLQEAYREYRDSGGSMKALLTSILTSDAFLYRKVEVGRSIP